MLVRHGHYMGENLSELGKGQVQMLARALDWKLEQHRGKISIISSPTVRAKETAEIIERALETNRLEFREEISDSYGSLAISKNSQKIYQELLDDMGDTEIVIIVTHLPFVEEFARLFTKEFGRLDVKLDISYASATMCYREQKFIRLFHSGQ